MNSDLFGWSGIDCGDAKESRPGDRGAVGIVDAGAFEEGGVGGHEGGGAGGERGGGAVGHTGFQMISGFEAGELRPIDIEEMDAIFLQEVEGDVRVIGGEGVEEGIGIKDGAVIDGAQEGPGGGAAEEE